MKLPNQTALLHVAGPHGPSDLAAGAHRWASAPPTAEKPRLDPVIHTGKVVVRNPYGYPDAASQMSQLATPWRIISGKNDVVGDQDPGSCCDPIVEVGLVLDSEAIWQRGLRCSQLVKYRFAGGSARVRRIPEADLGIRRET